MRTNLQIDYANVSSNFLNLSNEFDSSKLNLKGKECSVKEEVAVIDLTDFESTDSLNFLGNRNGRNSLEKSVSEMHDRVVKRARKELTE